GTDRDESRRIDAAVRQRQHAAARRAVSRRDFEIHYRSPQEHPETLFHNPRERDERTRPGTGFEPPVTARRRQDGILSQRRLRAPVLPRARFNLRRWNGNGLCENENTATCCDGRPLEIELCPVAPA